MFFLHLRALYSGTKEGSARAGEEGEEPACSPTERKEATLMMKRRLHAAAVGADGERLGERGRRPVLGIVAMRWSINRPHVACHDLPEDKPDLVRLL